MKRTKLEDLDLKAIVESELDSMQPLRARMLPHGALLMRQGVCRLPPRFTTPRHERPKDRLT